MSDAMVERVARAIYEAYRSAPDWDEMDERVREEWRGGAREAIEAMREPTNQMVDAADEATGYKILRDEDIRVSWCAMINAALKEPDFTLTVQNPEPEPMKATVTGVDYIR